MVVPVLGSIWGASSSSRFSSMYWINAFSSVDFQGAFLHLDFPVGFPIKPGVPVLLIVGRRNQNGFSGGLPDCTPSSYCSLSSRGLPRRRPRRSSFGGCRPFFTEAELQRPGHGN